MLAAATVGVVAGCHVQPGPAMRGQWTVVYENRPVDGRTCRMRDLVRTPELADALRMWAAHMLRVPVAEAAVAYYRKRADDTETVEDASGTRATGSLWSFDGRSGVMLFERQYVDGGLFFVTHAMTFHASELKSHNYCVEDSGEHHLLVRPQVEIPISL
jgi:hypothetical protein